MRRLWIALLAIGCAGAPSPTPTPPAPQPIVTQPAPRNDELPAGVEPIQSAALDEVESNLMELDFIVRFEVRSEGAVVSNVFGELRAQGEQIELQARGKFDDKVIELSLRGNGRELSGQSGEARLSLPQPPALKEALVIGLTRMGILHNIAVLMSARPPDHADGGVRQWVEAKDVVFGVGPGPSEPGEDAQAEDPTAISFDIVVAGQPAGEVTLWVDTAADVPLERHQVVHFAQGDMRVTERYSTTLLRRAG